MQLTASAMTGFSLGAVYDILRAVRRTWHRNALPDALFCLVMLASLFTLGMDVGQGGMSIFMLCAAAAGFAAYMALLSPALLPAFLQITAYVKRIFAPLSTIAKKLGQSEKLWDEGFLM